MTPTPEKTNQDSSPRTLWYWIFLLLVLIVVLLAFLRCSNGASTKGSGRDSIPALVRVPVDSINLDSLIKDSMLRADSVAERLRRQDSLQARIRSSRVPRTKRSDSVILMTLPSVSGDTTPPYVRADPAPGVHPAPVDVRVIVEELNSQPLCGPSATQMEICPDLFHVRDSLHLFIAGRDSAGNVSPSQEIRYSIDPDASRCGAKRALVPVGSGAICVDAYEWPNDPRGRPTTAMSRQEAQQVCASEGRRLCTNTELQAACEGPEKWAYPYGSRFVLGHCAVDRSSLSRGVDHPACRSWWGAFDLVGNAWEWTSSNQGSQALVFGGFWNDGSEARCSRLSRSFYPQNRYEAVGFRCCQEAPAP